MAYPKAIDWLSGISCVMRQDQVNSWGLRTVAMGDPEGNTHTDLIHIEKLLTLGNLFHIIN